MRDVHGIDGAEDDPKHGDASDDEGTLEEGPGGEDDGEAADDEGSGDGPTAEPEEPQVHEVSPERPRRRRHGKGRRRHRRRGRPEEEPKPNKKMYAIVIGLVVIVPLIGAAWFFFGPAGSIRKIDLIARPYVGSDKVSGIQLAAIIDTGKPSSVSGSADVKISHDGAGVYSGRLDVSESQAQRNLPLNQFAVGNGDYRVELSFQGTTTSTVFTLTEIIEWMNVTAFNLTQLNNATLVPAGTARIGFTVTFLSNAEAAQIAAENDRLEVEIIKGGVSEKHTETVGARPQINKNYPVSGNGNYTVRATFFSSKVKPGSQYSRIEATANDSFTKRPYVQVSIPPTAVPRSDKTTAQWKLADGGAVFKFDATGSIAYEGATFWNYTWDFGDDEWSIEAKATHTYTKVPSADQPLRYIVTLTVVDSNEQSASAQIQVTVTL
jgi:hypothetical protein